MEILLTGGTGFTGKAIAKILTKEHRVRSLDIRPSGPDVHEGLVGDIADLATCERAVEGMDAVVLCHMAPNPDGYHTPVQAIDINVKGAANIYHAMAKRQMKRAVLISSTGVLRDSPEPVAIPGEGPYSIGPAKGMYGLTKVLQEMVSRYYFETHGMITTILRPGWIVDHESLMTKYGNNVDQYVSHLIDPRDIGEAVLAALRLPDPKFEAFALVQDDSPRERVEPNTRLGWKPQYRFEALRRSPVSG
jgi:nucleoside-diphosphate-sugar epimerase